MATSEQRCQVWLLHRRPYRNTSLILDCLAEGAGRIGVVARGGRRDPQMQAFRPLLMTLTGRTELKTLRQVEALGPQVPLVGQALYCGLYLNELLVRLLHRDDPQDALLPLYRHTLDALAANDTPLDVLLRRFEYQLLEQLGYGFSLEHEVAGQAICDSARYHLVPDQGLVADSRGSYLGADLLAIAAEQWQADSRRTARALMRAALAPHLGERPLRSRELFRAGAGRARGTTDSDSEDL